MSPVSHAEALPVRLWPRQPLMLPLQEADFPRGAELREHQGPVSCCGFSADGGRLATGGRDRVSPLLGSWAPHPLPSRLVARRGPGMSPPRS